MPPEQALRAQVAVHPDVGELLQRSIGSLKLAIEVFNRPNDEGRAEAVLILLHHGFELILKTLILARAGTVFDEERGYSYSFDTCLRFAEDDLKVISKDQRRFLSMLDNLRDCAIHYYQVMSEDLLYIFAQGSVSLYDYLFRLASGQSLKDRLPARVLPLSSKPPKDLHLLVDQEFKNLRQALKDLSFTREKAIAVLRPLMAFAVGAEDSHRRMTTKDLDEVIEKLGLEEDWRLVFPEIAKLRVTCEGDGILMGVKIVKDSPTAMPVRVVKASDTEEPQGTVITKEVNIFDKFNMGLRQLSEKLEVTQPRTLTLILYCGVQDDPEAFREIKIGSQHYRRYSKRALDILRMNVGKAGDAWKKHRCAVTNARKGK